jgi:hypothetical protein
MSPFWWWKTENQSSKRGTYARHKYFLQLHLKLQGSQVCVILCYSTAGLIGLCYWDAISFLAFIVTSTDEHVPLHVLRWNNTAPFLFCIPQKLVYLHESPNNRLYSGKHTKEFEYLTHLGTGIGLIKMPWRICFYTWGHQLCVRRTGKANLNWSTTSEKSAPSESAPFPSFANCTYHISDRNM